MRLMKSNRARWLPNVSSETVWRAMRLCQIDIYLRPPHIVTHDAGKQFIEIVFQTSVELFHINKKCVPIECPNSMSYTKRYHTPIRHGFWIIKSEAPDIKGEAALQMAVKSVNDSTEPDGLVPTLLVYAALPCLDFPSDKPTVSTFQRAMAFRKATKAMTQNFVKSQISSAVRTRNAPDISGIHNTPLGSHVLVYCPESIDGTGPLPCWMLKMKHVPCFCHFPQDRRSSVQLSWSNSIKRMTSLKSSSLDSRHS